jgi:hypothetical protein
MSLQEPDVDEVSIARLTLPPGSNVANHDLPNRQRRSRGGAVPNLNSAVRGKSFWVKCSGWSFAAMRPTVTILAPISRSSTLPGKVTGHGDAATRDRFDLPMMTVADWEDGRTAIRTNASRRPGS